MGFTSKISLLGFAVTSRRSPQAFSVIPLVVYRVYVDGQAG